MENVNKQLIVAAKDVLALHDNEVFVADPWSDSMEDLRQAIAAAEQAQQFEPVAWQYRARLANGSVYGDWHGCSKQVHDRYKTGEFNGDLMFETRELYAQPPAVAVPTIKLGLYGRAFDTPQTRRAYTYREQPDNIGAYKLGRAVLRAASGGDSIDYGLSLLKELQAHGFGVFELGDQQEGGQQ